MKAVMLLLLLWTAPLFAANPISASPFRVGDPSAQPLTASEVRVTYLGTNGYLLETGATKLVIDPYFTRAPLWRVALGLRMETSEEARELAKAHLPERIDAILVTHGHFDHLLDVPWIARRTRARIVASATSTHLARAAGATKMTALEPGERITIAGARIQALAASHDCLFGRVPFPGTLSETPTTPRHPAHWVCGEPLAFLIEMGGRRIYVDSGGTPAVLPPAKLGRIDLAILGVALRDSRERLPATLDRLKPRYFLPSHQDNFFVSMRRGFRFGAFTDFPLVTRIAAKHRMVVLDYFQPWTLR